MTDLNHMNSKFNIYLNIVNLVMQMKEMSVKERIGIGLTLFGWVSAVTWAIAIPTIIIIHMVK
ncbi:MAG TPA: hypothetical protein VNW29_02905 [Candidatus Sulfotelmatobacter sp.]|nr:hypothetical protein [Candidatus Sulfotelmatobacter sp.]